VNADRAKVHVMCRRDTAQALFERLLIVTDLDACRDGLALIAAAERGDGASVEALLATFQGADNERERGQLLGSLLAHAVSILQLASQTLGVEPAKILGSVAASLNEPTPGRE
jgi:hypothetical protein